MSDKRVEETAKRLASRVGLLWRDADEDTRNRWRDEASWLLNVADAADDCVRVPRELYRLALEHFEEKAAYCDIPADDPDSWSRVRDAWRALDGTC